MRTEEEEEEEEEGDETESEHLQHSRRTAAWHLTVLPETVTVKVLHH